MRVPGATLILVWCWRIIRWARIAYREDAELGRAAVVDVDASGPNVPAFVDREPPAATEGCVRIRTAVRR
jgi:hypothetical protein